MSILIGIQAAGLVGSGWLAWTNGVRGNRPTLAALCGIAFIAWFALLLVTLGRL